MIYCGKDYTPSHPLEYFLRGKPRRVIHPETGELLESLLRQLAEEGEESVYARIRALIKSGKEY